MDNFETPERNPGLNPPSSSSEGNNASSSSAEAHPPETISGWLATHGVSVGMVIALFGVFIYFQGKEPTTWSLESALDGVWSLAKVILGLGLVIFIHELGHFLVAKWCDVHVETFSIGFGPAWPGCKYRWGETTYMIALFPLGGYVKMVGEGDAPDEEEDDPRSFKNKTVGQRMAIISAGVIMNVIMGCLCFIYVYMTHGVERAPGTIGMLEAGGPAWVKGLRAGMVIERIGDAEQPHFEDLMNQVITSKEGVPLALVHAAPGQPAVTTEILPRKDENDSRPLIGVAPARTLSLLPVRAQKYREKPTLIVSAASEATPPFEFGDVIVATSDPSNPDKILPLPDDPRRPGVGQRDFFEFERRQHLLAGKPMVIQVRRTTAKGDDEMVDITVPPAYHYSLGLRMRMGKIAAVREQSPAQQAEVRQGDIINRVKALAQDGRTLLELSDAGLDPLRLPDQLERALAGQPNAKVVLTVLRPDATKHVEKGMIDLELTWDHAHEFDLTMPLNRSSPMAIEGLGLAYRVETTVEGVGEGSPATHANLAGDDQPFSLQKDDVIEEVRFREQRKGGEPKWGFWLPLKPDQWAFVSGTLQINDDYKEIEVKIRRGGKQLGPIHITATPDRTWPADERGLLFLPDLRLQKAQNMGEAISLGIGSAFAAVQQVYQHLRGFLSNRLSVKNLVGPLTIATTAFSIAGEDLTTFVRFLGIISINLAVINFLPIPVLDGGHMVFLFYELLRRKPASDQVRVGATYAGLLLLVSLMLFVLFLDVKRMWFGL